MNIDFQWPGSVHNAEVFANFAINSELKNGSTPLTSRALFLEELK